VCVCVRACVRAHHFIILDLWLPSGFSNKIYCHWQLT